MKTFSVCLILLQWNEAVDSLLVQFSVTAQYSSQYPCPAIVPTAAAVAAKAIYLRE